MATELEILVKMRDEATKQLNTIGANIKQHQKAIGIGMVAAGGAIMAGLGMSMKAAADFEGAMREVNTMMGLSQDGFTAFSKDVQKLSSDLGVDAVESAKAMYQAISAGIPKENAIEFLAIATKAAIGGVTDTKTAVDGLTTVINAFRLPLSDTQKVADLMFTTVKGGKTTFEELSAAMFNVAPIAAAAGMSFDDISAALATMTKQGVPTKIATTQLRAALQQLLKPTTDMIATIEEAGLAFYNQTDATRAAKDALGPLQAAVDTAETAFNSQKVELDKLRLSYQLTTDEMANMTDEMDDLGDKQSEIRLRMRKIRFEASREGRELTDREIMELNSLELETEALGIAYDELAIKKDDLSEATTKEVEGIKIAEDANIALEGTLRKTKDALLKGKDAFAASQTDIKAFSEILNEINKGDLTTQQIIKMFGSIEAGSAILALTGANAEAFAKDLDAMANSEGAAEAAFKEMEKSAQRQMDALKASMQDITITIGTVLLPVLKQVVDNVMPVIESIKNWVAENPELTKTIAIASLALGVLLTFLGGLLLILPGLSVAVGLFGVTLSAAIWPITLVVLAVAALIAVGILLWKNWDKVRLFFIGMWLTLTDIFKVAWGTIKSNTIDPLLTAVDWITEKWGALITFFEGLLVSIRSIFNQIAQAMYQPIKIAIDWIINMINNMIRAINMATTKVGISIPTIPFKMPDLPSFDQGGIAMKPMIARVAGNGPEAMIPLSKLDTMGGGRKVNIIVELDGKAIARAIGLPLVDLIRVKTGARI